MAIIGENEIKRDLSSVLSPCYLIYGDDTYLKKLYADKIAKKAALGDPFFNMQRFESDCDLQEVYDAVTQFPMMADSKSVTLIDYDFENAAKSDFDRLCRLLSEETNDTCVLVLRFDGVPFDAKKKSGRAAALIKAVEDGGGKAVCLNHRKLSDIIRVLTDGAAKRGVKLDAANAKYMIESVGTDIATLQNELEKLCMYSSGKPIDKKMIDLVSVKTVEASVYNLTREIMAGKVAEALKLLDDLFFMRLEPIIILHTISSFYVELYRVAVAKKNGVPISEVAAKFGYKGREFVLERAANNLRNTNEKKLQYSFDLLLKADKALKSFGCEARTVLEELIVSLVYIVLKGEPID